MDHSRRISSTLPWRMKVRMKRWQEEVEGGVGGHVQRHCIRNRTSASSIAFRNVAWELWRRVANGRDFLGASPGTRWAAPAERRRGTLGPCWQSAWEDEFRVMRTFTNSTAGNRQTMPLCLDTPGEFLNSYVDAKCLGSITRAVMATKSITFAL